jgi:hypothetical protein
MTSQAKTAIALFGGATMLTLGFVFGGGGELSSSTTTSIATPMPIVTPAPAPTAVPKGPATGKSTKGFVSSVVAPVVFPERTTS